VRGKGKRYLAIFLPLGLAVAALFVISRCAALPSANEGTVILPENPAPSSVVANPTAEEPCAYVWANQPLDAVSAALQAGLPAEQAKQIQITASAYGENCLNADGSVRRFARMQTDLYVTVSLEDQQAGSIRSAIDTLAAAMYSYSQVAGAEKLDGTAWVSVSSPDMETLYYSFGIEPALTAYSDGLRGEALMDALNLPLVTQ
jgi:hypothetical protein